MDLLDWVKRKAMEMIRVMEHFSYEDYLKELGLFSLQKRRLWRNLIAASQCLKGLYKKGRTNFLAGLFAIGKKFIVLYRRRVDLG